MFELKSRATDKVYQARIALDRAIPLKKLKDLVGKRFKVRQRTPSRVSSRRSDLLRERKAQVLKAEKKGKDFLIDLKAGSGLYVKEFVSGDSGRTRPSLTELLGVPCTCKELDVLEIL